MGKAVALPLSPWQRGIVPGGGGMRDKKGDQGGMWKVLGRRKRDGAKWSTYR